MKKILLLFLLLAAGLSPLSAVTYYVRTDGNDSNAGTANTSGGAWLTIQKAASTVVAGDTVEVQAGTYAEAVSETTSGSLASPIVFNGNGKVIVGGFSLAGADFVEVRNFTLDGTGVGATTSLIVTDATAHNNTFSNIATVGVASWLSGRGGITSSGTNCYFDSIRITNHGNSAITFFGQGTTITNCIITGQNAWDVFRPFGSNSKITGCLVTNVSNTPFSGGSLEVGVTYGFSSVSGSPDFSNVGAPSPPYTVNQTFTATGTTPTAWGSASLHNANHSDIYQVFGDNGAVVTNMVIERNHVYNGYEYQFGNVTDDRETNDISGWMFSNNVFVDITRTMNLYAPNFRFYNNTFVRVGPDSSWPIIYGSSGAGHAHGLHIVNNIFEMCGDTNSANKGWYSGAAITNTWFGYNLVRGNTPKTGYTPEAGSIKDVDPLLSATTYKPATNSPVLNAGTNLLSFVSIDFDGLSRDSTPSLGAFEASGESEDYTPTIVTNNASGSRVSGFRNLAMAVLPVTPHNHPASPLLFENFEGAGYSTAGWNEYIAGTGNSINEDNTTNVLSGSQSLAIVGISDDPSCITNSFSASSEVFGYFEFQCLKYPSEDGDAYRQVMRLETEDGTTLFHLLMFNTGTLYIQTGAASDGALAGPLSLGQTYHVWWSWNKNNGSNSEATIAYSTTKVKPTSGDTFVSITGSTIAEDATRIMVGYDNTSSELDLTLGGLFNGAPSWIYDYLILDDVEIPSYP